MRPIRWLHLSDIHMRPRDAWSQDVVLRAMLEDVKQRCGDNTPDFVLVSGDLAFSGKAEEYALIPRFLDALAVASGVQRERIYCVPGNHDIDRGRQNLAFAGARFLLQDQNRTDALLDPASREDLDALLKRQEAYRRFHAEYFRGQERIVTEDGLGYVSRMNLDDVRLAIVALDSTWLAAGGVEDHGKLLIGERQVINAIRLAQAGGDPPDIVVAMSHHPLHVLQEFDRRPIQSRLDRGCQFLHCGHLHEPDARQVGADGRGCLTLSAGASFETRQTQNSYSFVMLDLLHARRSVTTLHYNARDGLFSRVSTQDYPIEVQPNGACAVGALATAAAAYNGDLAAYRHYLAALILDQKADIVVPAADGGYTFGSLALLESLPDSDLKRKSGDFFVFRNALRVLYPRMPIEEVFRLHGHSVLQYGRALSTLAAMDVALKGRLDAHEEEARRLAAVEPQDSSWHTAAMLKELAESQEWVLLREHAERHIDLPDREAAVMARRMLALALANSTELADKEAAIVHYKALTGDSSPEPTDFGNLALLLMERGDSDNAKAALLAGIGRCLATAAGYFLKIGHTLVETTADKEFRRQLEAASAQRGKA